MPTDRAKAERPVPHDLDAERAVLGAVLVNEAKLAEVTSALDTSDFFRDAHRRIFRAMRRLNEGGHCVDLMTIKADLHARDELETVGGPAYIACLVDGVPKSTNAKQYARLVKELSQARSMMTLFERGIRDIRSNPSVVSNGLPKAVATRLAAIANERSVVNRVPELDARDYNLSRITGEAWAAFNTANDPEFLFRQGDAVSRVQRGEDGVSFLRPLDQDALRYELARCARWYRTTKDGSKKDEYPPSAVGRNMLADPEPPLSRIAGVVHAPTFSPDGQLHLTPGYQPATRTFYAPRGNLVVPKVPVRPTQAQIAAARHLIVNELFVDFPFRRASDRANAISLFLLPFARNLIEGPLPLYVIAKPAPGTGASLFVDITTQVALGQAAPVMTEGRHEDEWRKRITAVLIAGPSVVVIDNLRRRLDSAALSAAITARTWEDRLLGASRTVRVPVNCVWIATGNNPGFTAEMSRRVVPVWMDAKVERPWERTRFTHPDLRKWSDQHRGVLIAAALTLVRGWLAAGRPEGTAYFGSFESWARVMGGVLSVAGVDHFLGDLSSFYEDADQEGADARAFLARWWEAFQTRQVGVAQLFPLLAPDRADPLDLGLGDGSDRSRQTKFGNWLKRHRDRIYRLETQEQRVTVQVVADGLHQGAKQWRLVEINGEAGEPS